MSNANKNAKMALVGTILDMSASMRVNVEGKGDNDYHWLRSVFETFNDLLERNEISEDNKIFATGTGLNKQLKRDTFDLVGTLETSLRAIDLKESLSKSEVVYESMEILKFSGAPFVHEWAPENEINNVVSGEKAKIILNWLCTDENLSRKVAMEVLLDPCRNRAKTIGRRIMVGSSFRGSITNSVTATTEDIEEVV